MAFLDLEALLRTPQVNAEGGFDLSPDGRRLAFAWNTTGQWEIYQLNLGSQTAIERLTDGPGAKFSPKYSPNGQYLAYVVDDNGSEAFDIWLLRLRDRLCANLTPGTPEAFQPNLSWSPDSAHLACLSNRSGHFCAYLLPVHGGEARLALDTPNPDWTVRWSPDGRWVAVEAEGHGQDQQVHLISIETGQAHRLELGAEPFDAHQVCWSPDSLRLAFVSSVDGHANIAVYDLQEGQISWLTRSAAEQSAPDWSPDGRMLAFIHSQGPQNWLATLELATGEQRRFQVAPGVHASPRFTLDGDHLAFCFENPGHPTDLWLLSLSDGALRPLTQSLPEKAVSHQFIMPEHINYPAQDGQMIPALLYQPDACPEPSPAVVLVHGGPNWLFQYAWSPLIQHLLSRGWLVLAPNYRGSTGYGREWQLANRFDLGGGDAADVAAGATYLASEKLADPQRIVISGRSHGGYLTMVCLTQYPEIWAGGSAVVPFLNWFTAHANARDDLQHWDLENMGDPQQYSALWRARSPFYFLDQIQAPVQLICGVHDSRCPASESIATRDRLQALGRPVAFHLYTDEGHAFLKIKNVIDAEMRRVNFLAQCLSGAGVQIEQVI